MQLSNIHIHLPATDISHWVDSYLRGIGGNIPLADWLLKAQRFRIWPLILPLRLLERSCGPEENMEYKISATSFDETIERVVWYITEVKQMEPFICNYKSSILSIRDWNHRYGALQKLWIHSFYVLIWADSKIEYNACIDFISNSLV